MIEVTCKDCDAFNQGENSYNTFFGMQSLHKDGCSQSYSTGYSTYREDIEHIINSDNEYDTRTIIFEGQLDSKGRAF